MKISTWIILASLIAGCGGGGGSASIPEADACNQASTSACAKIYSCETALATSLFGTQDQCQTMILGSCGSTGFQCATTQTYHGDKAAMCKDQFTAMDCSTLLQTVLPTLSANASLSGAFGAITASLPVCGQICTTP